jgi:hypothetical protein
MVEGCNSFKAGKPAFIPGGITAPDAALGMGPKSLKISDRSLGRLRCDFFEEIA